MRTPLKVITVEAVVCNPRAKRGTGTDAEIAPDPTSVLLWALAAKAVQGSFFCIGAGG